MGWTFSHSSRSELVDHLTATDAAFSGSCLAFCDRGDALWQVRYIPSLQHPVILVSLIDSSTDRGRTLWGSKDMGEDVGPYLSSCPAEFLDLAPPVPGSWSEAFRARVRAWNRANPLPPQPVVRLDS